MRTNFSLALLFTFFVFINANAQIGSVSGIVKTTDNKPLEAATVSLLRVKDSSLTKIALADKTGAYKFENLQYGSFKVLRTTRITTEGMLLHIPIVWGCPVQS